jgi:hypothetical protein
VLDAWSPHNVTVRCSCGQFSCGISDHIWTVKTEGIWTPDARGIIGSLSPSYNWLNDPHDASRGSHLHDFVVRVPILGEAALHLVAA